MHECSYSIHRNLCVMLYQEYIMRTTNGVCVMAVLIMTAVIVGGGVTNMVFLLVTGIALLLAGINLMN